MNARTDGSTRVTNGRQLLLQAKERIRTHRALSYFDAAFNHLNGNPNDGEGWYLRGPHVAFLIAKWSLASWRPDDDRPHPSEEDIRFVFQTTWDAIGSLHEVDEKPTVFMRRMVLQQIWFQRRFDPASLARQFRILGEMMEQSEISQRFETEYGLTLKQFITQLAHLAADTGDQLELEPLSIQRPATPRNLDHWQLLLERFTRSVPHFHEMLSALEARGTPAEVEVCEQSPFIQSPFLLSHTGPICIHHKLLFQTLTTAAFDAARSIAPRLFMNSFGPAFEDYVAEVFGDLTDQDVIREEELEHRLIGPGNVVDFALPTDEVLVLADAKGVEGHYDELYHNLPAVLAERLKTSLLRAVDQAISTVERLPDELRRANTYFICVTFKQLVVADGVALRELTRGTEEWEHSRWRSELLPPGRMLFVSIYELETMVALTLARGMPLCQLINEIVEANSSPHTRKALVEQHVVGQMNGLLLPTCAQLAANRLRA